MLNMQEETDGSLLYYMSSRDCDADRVISDAATIEFHSRHARGLIGRCRRICRTLAAGDEFALDLASWTLARAVEKAGTFVDAADGSNKSKRTLAWLQQIARNMLVDSQRNPFRAGPITGAQDQVPIEDYSDEEFAALLCDGKTLPRDIKTIGFVQRALATLDNRTRAVLAQTVLQRQRSPGRSYMYRGSAEALASRWGTTTTNIRRIRRAGIRALAMLWIQTCRRRLRGRDLALLTSWDTIFWIGIGAR
jgi:DNA-directed RNA polymerase specialized sigma24 family protein